MTSASLLERLRRPDPAASDWQRLDAMYAPLIRAWIARLPGIGTEADDLTQEVLIVLVRELPTFQRERDGSFRVWLRRVTVNRVRTWRRSRKRLPLVGLDPADDFLTRLEDPASDLADEWDREHNRHVRDRLFAAIRRDFEPATWEAFTLFALDGLSAAEAGARTGMTAAGVVSAKARVLKRLRDEAAGILD